MADEWGPWVEHDGSGCPPEVQIGRRIQAITRNRHLRDTMHDGVVHQGVVDCPSWAAKDPFGSWEMVVRYRLRRPPAIQRLVDLVEGLPEPVREDA